MQVSEREFPLIPSLSLVDLACASAAERAGEWPARQQESEALEVPPVSMEITGIVNEIDKRTCLCVACARAKLTALSAARMRQPMIETMSLRPRWAIAAALVAVAFGIITIIVGGKTLFGGPAIRTAAGNIVSFVLWFNFIAGFAYVVAGLGLFLWKRWAAQLSAAIAVATIAVFVAFGVHVLLGGAFETRTVGAMTLRSAVWIVLAIGACRILGCVPRGTGGKT